MEEGEMNSTFSKRMRAMMEKVVVSRVIKSQKTIDELWELYCNSFPMGYGGYTRDLTKVAFKRAMKTRSYIKFYITKDAGEIAAFTLVSDSKKEIVGEAYRDPLFLASKVPTGKKIFWIFAVCVNGKTHDNIGSPKNGKEFIATAGRMFGYILEKNGVAFFDREEEDTIFALEESKKICFLATGKKAEAKDIGKQITSAIW
jgi:hypothetical protein